MPVTKDNVADEVKALKDTVAQLRSTTKTLSDNFAALKTSVDSQQRAEHADRQDRRDARARREVSGRTAQDAAAAAAAADPHGSRRTRAIASPTSPARTASRPTTAAEPNGALKNSVVQGWVLRRVYDGAALIEGRDGIIEVEPGIVAPGLGRIEGIKRQDGRWVVMTSRGIVIGR